VQKTAFRSGSAFTARTPKKVTYLQCEEQRAKGSREKTEIPNPKFKLLEGEECNRFNLEFGISEVEFRIRLPTCSIRRTARLGSRPSIFWQLHGRCRAHRRFHQGTCQRNSEV